MTEAMEGIRQAAADRDLASYRRQLAVGILRHHVEQAHKEGVPITQIAEAAGLSRQGVYDLLQRPA
jgi:DNA-binding phage protein